METQEYDPICNHCKGNMWADVQCKHCGENVCTDCDHHHNIDGAFYCERCGDVVNKWIDDELAERDYCEKYKIESEFTPQYREPQI